MMYVLWDASDIWGPLALWGLRGLGVPHRIVRAADIAAGLLDRPDAKLLLVPGGFSRHKDAALGDAGRDAVRRFVNTGGSYLGFCGGAGLALAGGHSLGICPWGRAGYENRIQHYMSGHFYVTLKDEQNACAAEPEQDAAPCPAPDPEHDVTHLDSQRGPAHRALAGMQGARPSLPEPGLSPLSLLPPSPLLPVWWPGRFAPGDENGVTVLARYDEPGPDFWLADLPVADLPPSVFADWEEKYGFSLSPSFLRGEPCVIHGRYGQGQYVLAYSHLETPESPDANLWLAHLLRTLGGGSPERALVPAWDLDNLTPAWEDPDLLMLWKRFAILLDSGRAAGLFFTRSSWLMGWRTGLPGAICNTVRAHLHTALSLPACPEAAAYWDGAREAFVPAFRAFAKRATNYLLAERLAMTLSKDLPETLVPEKLLAERTAIFGASGMAAHTGGMLAELLPVLDELAFLQIRGNAAR
ncbi:conserved hypothetical protein [uncultured delta proteobacterium]|uniref:Biotin-protein ligase N-terminal domain-containing protein n=1 Tax=uncultured delta proteobacterium TaxID=34034 RepID=A0A212JZK4_9DELT|nr:conserved hypothetical protein [uncultured delta proteobacterium]